MPNPTPKPSPTSADTTSVTVDIYDQLYHLRGSDPAQLQQLAALVDSKMRAVASSGTTVDSLRVAVLAALNLADELLALRARATAPAEPSRDAPHSLPPDLRARTHSLSTLLDQVLDPASIRRAG